MHHTDGLPARCARSDHIRRIALVAGVIASQTLFGVLYAQVPPCPDQSELDYTGWQALNGARPYVDFVSMNWPGAHWMHMTAIATFGNNIHAWRIADYLLMLVALWSFAILLRRSFGPVAAMVSLLVYPILFHAGQWLTGQRDFVCAHLLLLAFYFQWQAEPAGRAWWQIPAGLCIAVATLIKPTFLAAAAVLPLHGFVFSMATPLNWRRQLVRVALLAAATFGGLATAFLLLRVEGTPFEQFWNAAIATVTEAYNARELPASELFARLGFWLVNPWWWISGFAILSPLAVFGVRAAQSRLAVNVYGMIVSLLGVALASAMVQGKGYMYQAAGVYVALVLLSILAAAAFVRYAADRRVAVKGTAIVLLLLFGIGVGSRVNRFYRPPFEYLAGHISAEEFYSQFDAGGITYSDAMKISERIRAEEPPQSDENTCILVWSLANFINNRTGEPQGTRFHHPPALLIANRPFRLADQWRESFRHDLKASQPFACVVSSKFVSNNNDEAVRFLRDYLAAQYHPALTFKGETETTTLYLRQRHAPRVRGT